MEFRATSGTRLQRALAPLQDSFRRPQILQLVSLETRQALRYKRGRRETSGERGFAIEAFRALHHRILKVSRTIADLDGAESVAPKQLSVAIQYRTLDRSYWA